MVETYYYVRFRWWSRLDLEKISREFSKQYQVRMLSRPSGEDELALLKDQRNELEVKSDTLTVLLSPFRAVLTQEKPLSFTNKDLELRKKVFELYLRDRPTPFPWEFGREPNFEVFEEK